MLICGIKLTHDAAVAVIDNDKLLFCDEVEKINNNTRYSEILDVELIESILKQNYLSLNNIDLFAIDGWGGYDQDKLAIQPRLTIGGSGNFISVRNGYKKYELKVAEYEEKNLDDYLIFPKELNGLQIGKKSYGYHSYLHVAGHMMSAYTVSPFAQRGEDSYILVWDGGMFPRLYFFDSNLQKINNLGPISFLVGNMYTIFSQHFEPFKVAGNFAKDDLSVAGKVMAYIAKGHKKEELFDIFESVYYEKYNLSMGFANVFAVEFRKRIEGMGYSDEDVLASFHKYLELHLCNKISKKIKIFGSECGNLCISGGCALNIKWNSAIRDSGIFENVFVPPFPNDSGSAIGVACCANFFVNKISRLKWSVYSGPQIIQNRVNDGWAREECSIKSLAKLIHESNEPIVVLHGRAELGPRALGHRSILASPINTCMKDTLNIIKKREAYRPISPICLVEEAGEYFFPHTNDSFMLFDYQASNIAKEKAPAVIHLDGSSRLQTVSKEDSEFLYKLLSYFYKISGVPILCNTSANMLGRGFFPDIESAAKWGKVNYIWSENSLYIKNKKNKYGR